MADRRHVGRLLGSLLATLAAAGAAPGCGAASAPAKSAEPVGKTAPSGAEGTHDNCGGVVCKESWFCDKDASAAYRCYPPLPYVGRPFGFTAPLARARAW